MNYDITVVNNDNEVLNVKQTITLLQQKSNDLIVNSKEAEYIGTDIRSNILKLTKQIKEKVKSFTAGAKEYIDNVNSIFKPILKTLDDIDSGIETKLITYHDECRKEAERIAREKEKEFEKAIEKGEAIPDDLEVPEVEKKVVSQYENRTSYIKQWTFKVVDELKIPREYLKIDEAKIREAIKKDRIRKIEGLEIYEETITRRG